MNVRLINLETGKRGGKLPGGHATSVTNLVFSPDGLYLASACCGRFVNVHSTAGEGSLVRTLTLDSEPRSLVLRTWRNSDASGDIHAAGVTLAACCDRATLSIFTFSGENELSSKIIKVSDADDFGGTFWKLFND